MSSYNVIKGVKNSVVVTGTINVTAGQLANLVDTNKTTSAITISGTQQISLFIDLGSRFAIDNVRVWANTTDISGTTIEYDFTDTGLVSPGEADIVFTTASGLVYHTDGYIYADFNYPSDTPNFIRITQAVPSGFGTLDIYEIEVINDDEYVDFGLDGTQEQLRVDHAPIGYESEANPIPIYNDSDELVDATVMIEKTNQPVDDMIKISSREEGPYTGRQDDVIMPDEISFNEGVFRYAQVSSNKVESTAKSAKTFPGAAFAVTQAQPWGPGPQRDYPNWMSSGCSVYDRHNDKMIYHASTEYQSENIYSSTVMEGWGTNLRLGDGSNTGIVGWPWNSAQPSTWADRYIGIGFLGSMSPDPYSDRLYTIEKWEDGVTQNTRATHVLNKFNLAHIRSRPINIAGGATYWEYDRKLGVGRDYFYTLSGGHLARCNKDTLEPVQAKTWASLGSTNDNNTYASYYGRWCVVSYQSDNIIYCLLPESYDAATTSHIFQLRKIDWNANESTYVNVKVDTGSEGGFQKSIRGMTIDLLDQIWIIHRDGGAWPYGFVKVYDSDLNLVAIDGYLAGAVGFNDRMIDQNSYGLDFVPEKGLVYMLTVNAAVSTSNSVFTFSTDKGESFSGIVGQSTYETPVIDLSESYNSSTIEWGADDSAIGYNYNVSNEISGGNDLKLIGYTGAPYSNGGLNLNGSNQLAYCGHGYPNGNSARTIMFEFNTDTFDTGVEDIICSYVAPYDAANGSYFYICAEDNAISVGFGNHRIITPKGALSTGTWYHVAVVVPASATMTGEILIYIDAVNQTLSDENSSSVVLNTSNDDFSIGYIDSNRQPGNWYDGRIRKVSIWDTDLPASGTGSITYYKDNPVLGNETNLLSYWPLDASLNNVINPTIAKYEDDGRKIIEVRTSNTAPTVKRDRSVGDWRFIIPGFYNDQYTYLTERLYGKPSICSDGGDILYVGGYRHTNNGWADGFGYYNIRTKDRGMLDPIDGGSTKMCWGLEYVEIDGSGYVYAFMQDRSVFDDYIFKYDVSAYLWSQVYFRDGNSNSRFFDIPTRTCVDPVNKVIYVANQYRNSNSFRKFDTIAEVFSGVPADFPGPGYNNSMTHGTRLCYVDYNGIVRIIGFGFGEYNAPQSYYMAFYDIDADSWSTTNPWVNTTRRLPNDVANNPAIWDGDNLRWATANGTLHVGDRVYMVKGGPYGSNWVHFSIGGDTTPNYEGSNVMGQYTRRFGYYSLTENRWYQMPDLPMLPKTDSYGSGDRLFLYDENTIVYIPFTYSIRGTSQYQASVSHIIYLYNIADETWEAGYSPSDNDPVWGPMPYEEIASDSILLPQNRYIQAKFYFNNIPDAAAKLEEIIIPRGITIQDIPPQGTKNVYVKTDIPIDESVATKIAKLKVWWHLL